MLLVSVRNADEAEAALAGGADWIDLKEPSAGPLGAVPVTTATAIVDRVAGRRPVSAALGELTNWWASPAQQLLEVPGISTYKLGLAGCAARSSWQTDWVRAEAEVFAARKSLVAVAYADWQRAQAPEPKEIVSLAERTSCRYFLLDTFDKQSANTLEQLGATELRNILNFAHCASLRTVLAGRITLETVGQLPTNCIDIVAVRGGVCPQDRTGALDPHLVTEFRQALLEYWKR
jgi:uncharacterized protein (UPF0264 family)